MLNVLKRHFYIYLSENWMDLDETWQRDGEWGKIGPIKILASSRGPRERAKMDFFLLFLHHEYNISFFGHLLYGFPQNNTDT